MQTQIERKLQARRSSTKFKAKLDGKTARITNKMSEGDGVAVFFTLC